MFVANLAALTYTHMSTMAAWFFQEQAAVGWDPISLWHQMGIPAKAVVIILFVMSGWSIGVMIDRAMAFSAARKQSRAFAPAVAGALRDGKIEEAIKVAERNKKSHLAKVVTSGLMEFRAHQESGEIPGETIEASKRALERTEAIVHAELKRGLGGLATEVQAVARIAAGRAALALSLDQLATRAPLGPVGGNLRLLEPGAVGAKLQVGDRTRISAVDDFEITRRQILNEAPLRIADYRRDVALFGVDQIVEPLVRGDISEKQQGSLRCRKAEPFL